MAPQTASRNEVFWFTLREASNSVAQHDDEFVLLKSNSDSKARIVHKNVLRASSPYFRGLLDAHRGLSGPISLDISAEILDIVLKFLYLPSSMIVKPHHVIDLFSAAKQFELPKLQNRIRNYFTNNLQEIVTSRQLLNTSAIDALNCLEELCQGSGLANRNKLILGNQIMAWIKLNKPNILTRLGSMAILDQIMLPYSKFVCLSFVESYANNECNVKKIDIMSGQILDRWRCKITSPFKFVVRCRDRKICHSPQTRSIQIFERNKLWMLQSFYNEDNFNRLVVFNNKIYTCANNRIYWLEDDEDQMYTLREIADLRTWGQRKVWRLIGIVSENVNELKVRVNDGATCTREMIIKDGQVTHAKVKAPCQYLAISERHVCLCKDGYLIVFEDDCELGQLSYKALNFTPREDNVYIHKCEMYLIDPEKIHVVNILTMKLVKTIRASQNESLGLCLELR